MFKFTSIIDKNVLSCCHESIQDIGIAQLQTITIVVIRLHKTMVNCINTFIKYIF